MPTLPIEFVPMIRDLVFTVVLEDGRTRDGHINLEILGQVFNPGPDATVTFDSEEDLAGEHACTCIITESRSKITTANGVVIYNKSLEDATDEFGGETDSTEVSGTITWDT